MSFWTLVGTVRGEEMERTASRMLSRLVMNNRMCLRMCSELGSILSGIRDRTAKITRRLWSWPWSPLLERPHLLGWNKNIINLALWATLLSNHVVNGGDIFCLKLWGPRNSINLNLWCDTKKIRSISAWPSSTPLNNSACPGLRKKCFHKWRLDRYHHSETALTFKESEKTNYSSPDFNSIFRSHKRKLLTKECKLRILRSLCFSSGYQR